MIVLAISSCKSFYYNDHEIIHNSRIIKISLAAPQENISVTGKIRLLKKPIIASIFFKSKDTIIIVKSIEGNFECYLPKGVYELTIKSNQEPFYFKVVNASGFKLKKGEHKNIEVQLDADEDRHEIVFKSRIELEQYTKRKEFNTDCSF